MDKLAKDLCDGDAHPKLVSGEELLTLMTRGFGEQNARQSVASSAAQRESSFFGSESAVSVSVQGKTEVDLLSTTWSWARCGVKELVECLEPLTVTPRQVFARDLIEESSLVDFVQQTRDIHSETVDRLKELKKQAMHDIECLDFEIEEERGETDQLMPQEETGLPSLTSILKG